MDHCPLNGNKSQPKQKLLIVYSCLIISCIFLFGIFFTSCDESPQIENLRLTQIGPFNATLEWESDYPASFIVEYGEGRIFDRETVPDNSDIKHRVSLTGLKPSTRYSYRIKSNGQGAAFRSAPKSDGAFDMVILNTQSRLCRKEMKSSEIDPDIVIVSGPCESSWANRPESILTKQIPDSGIDTFVYGKNLIVLSSKIETALSFKVKESDRKKRPLYVVSEELVAYKLPADQLFFSPNRALYLGKLVSVPNELEAWLDVDAFEIAWVYRKDDKQNRTVIVEAPPETKKTCLYCDRLMEAGRYEESIAWYRNFIDTNQDRHAIEDAVYSIGRILDEKLFQYGLAIEEYNKFLSTYPTSRRKTLINYRLKYLKAHQDNGFIPLLRFEKAKAKTTVGRHSLTIETVEAIVREYPQSSVVPEALFWMGHLLERENPIRAIKYYNNLIREYPKIENAAIASIAIGDILYREKKYRKAVNAYHLALTISPATYHISINDKIRKSDRNIKREIAHYICWTTLLLWLLASFWWRSRPEARDFWAAILVFSIYGLAGGTYFALTFDRSRAIIPIVASIAFSSIVIIFWNRLISRAAGRNWITAAHVLTSSAAIIYLLLYAFHYLYIFGL